MIFIRANVYLLPKQNFNTNSAANLSCPSFNIRFHQHTAEHDTDSCHTLSFHVSRRRSEIPSLVVSGSKQKTPSPTERTKEENLSTVGGTLRRRCLQPSETPVFEGCRLWSSAAVHEALSCTWSGFTSLDTAKEESKKSDNLGMDALWFANSRLHPTWCCAEGELQTSFHCVTSLRWHMSSWHQHQRQHPLHSALNCHLTEQRGASRT